MAPNKKHLPHGMIILLKHMFFFQYNMQITYYSITKMYSTQCEMHVTLAQDKCLVDLSTL